MNSVRDCDEERSVIADKGDIGFIDFVNDDFMCNYKPSIEGPVHISVPFPLVGGKPHSGYVGERIVDSINIWNTTTEPVNLWKVHIYDSKPDESFTLSLMEPPSPSSDVGYTQQFMEYFTIEDRVLRPGKILTIWLSCKPKEIGLHTSAVHFTMDDETIERLAFVLAEDQLTHSLASDKTCKSIRRKKPWSNTVSPSGFVSGLRPPRASTQRFRHRLPAYSIPQNVRVLIGKRQIPKAVIEGLTKENYAPYFKHLVFMEELKMEDNMRGYGMECIYMKSEGSQFLTLEVPGLAERRPSLVYGDYVFAKLVSGDANDITPVYQGFIHRVEAEEVFLKFERRFHLSYKSSNLYNVQFTYNRLNMRRLHQAIEAAQSLEADFLFPSDSLESRLIHHTPLVPISLLNEEQICSIEMILGCHGGAPYVIYGPPGTGKTMTLIEAILQLYTTRSNAQILVCAPSNSAADYILEKLLSVNVVNVQTSEILRLNALTRSLEEIKPDIMKVCFYEDTEGIFKCPPISKLRRYKIIISTYVSSYLLYAEGIKKGHFSHIFLDEAGQASEPETMVPLSNLCSRNTVVVLAGDPMQLGPVICSTDAEFYGLGKSYLERLLEFKFYESGDQNYVTKLVRNYRSHPEILHLPSELFYQGELISCKDDDTMSSRAWVDLLPRKDFPVLFFGIQGFDERQGSNPSWFNRIEVSKTVEIIMNLTEKGGFGDEEIGVITPYRQQVLKIKKALEDFGRCNIQVGSVEQFQGQERQVIIISTVRSTIKHNEFDRAHCLGFLSNPKRFNVAITRARSLLIVIGNPHILSKDPFWNKFLWHCSDKGSYQGCFLPERQELVDKYQVQVKSSDYKQEKSIQHWKQGEWSDYKQEKNLQHCKKGEWGQTPRKVDWGQSSKDLEWGQPSEELEWGQEVLLPEEIPKPVMDESEWSDGWK